MGDHHQLQEEHDPLVPGMAPMNTRVLTVGGDDARLECLLANLHVRGYHQHQVTSSTDPAAAMAGLRQGGRHGLSFDVVIVDVFSQYPGCGGARDQLLEFAIREPRLCVYALREKGNTIPIEMKDLDIFRKPICDVAENGHKSLHDTPKGLYNTSPSTMESTVRNSPSSERRLMRRNRKHVRDTCSEEVEQDGEHVEKEQQKPAQKTKKDRVVWTDELHKKFVEAHDKLAAKGEAVPKKILALMKDSRLSRENIASHLQKHRLNLQREACTKPRRRSHSRTKHQRSTLQASFPSPNMPPQQAPPPPPTTMQHDMSATVYINYGMNAHATLEASTKSGMQDNHLVIHMQTFKATEKSDESVPVDMPPMDMEPGANDPKQNSCVSNSDDNGLHEDFSEILNNEPEDSWENKFLFSSGD